MAASRLNHDGAQRADRDFFAVEYDVNLGEAAMIVGPRVDFRVNDMHGRGCVRSIRKAAAGPAAWTAKRRECVELGENVFVHGRKLRVAIARTSRRSARSAR